MIRRGGWARRRSLRTAFAAAMTANRASLITDVSLGIDRRASWPPRPALTGFVRPAGQNRTHSRIPRRPRDLPAGGLGIPGLLYHISAEVSMRDMVFGGGKKRVRVVGKNLTPCRRCSTDWLVDTVRIQIRDWNTAPMPEPTLRFPFSPTRHWFADRYKHDFSRLSPYFRDSANLRPLPPLHSCEIS